MNYEKAYNEALERAKEIKSKILSSHLSTESCKAVSEYIDTIIPELRESEDERIRKFLLRLAKRCNENSIDFLGEIKKKDVIAYLEKQKEQKPAEWSEENEKIITRLISYFESFRIAGVATKWEGLDIQEVITLLKSLRPSWKPSEEQMDAKMMKEGGECL